ncbi:hypothetical protein CAL65_03470 [Alkalilimnicola ehrlichii]|uniref:Entericidin EcnAB n=2 Tax=Alkalilimnicola ehrlichii TaxID=351052 RepID=A0A3E0X118_9GAMM|nr:hypothetical protein CAL65_03470 [Alkalilimnicola ehrlichii]
MVFCFSVRERGWCGRAGAAQLRRIRHARGGCKLVELSLLQPQVSGNCKFAKLEADMRIAKIGGFAVPALLAAGFLLMAGCETTAGVGRDIESAGEGIEESAERHGAEEDRAEVERQDNIGEEDNIFD